MPRRTGHGLVPTSRPRASWYLPRVETMSREPEGSGPGIVDEDARQERTPGAPHSAAHIPGHKNSRYCRLIVAPPLSWFLKLCSVPLKQIRRPRLSLADGCKVPGDPGHHGRPANVSTGKRAHPKQAFVSAARSSLSAAPYGVAGVVR